MSNSIYTTLSSQVALRRKLDIVANNMANLGTTGFKQEDVHFDDVYKRLDTDGRGVAFVYDVTSTTDFTQGGFAQTGNNLDIAISGKGLLSVQNPQGGGTFYTRDGRLSRNSEGFLVLTSNNMRVLDAAGGPIQIPENIHKISIAGDGTISAADGGQLGRIGISEYQMDRVERLSDGLFRLKNQGQALAPDAQSRITQGFIENSNVNAVSTLTDLINVQRAYEMGSNLMDKEDKRIQDSISRMGRKT